MERVVVIRTIIAAISSGMHNILMIDKKMLEGLEI